MRKLMWFALGVALMCAAAAYLNMVAAGTLGLIALALVFGCCFLRGRKLFRVMAAVCIGLIAGFLICGIHDATDLSHARNSDGKNIDIEALVTDYSFKTEYGSAVRVQLSLDGRSYSAQLYMNSAMDLSPGDKIQGQFRLRYTGGENATYHFGKDILLLGYQRSDFSLEPGSRIPAILYPAVIRQRLIQIIDQSFSADTAYFAQAVLLGDRSNMDYETSTAFKVTGISHIVAVSGMHLSILASVVYILAGKRRWFMAALGIPAVICFAAIVGFTPSITRACIMQILLLIALILDRDYDPLTALATAAMVMLAINPGVITAVSFQLSFGCMVGIFLFSSKIYHKLSNFGFWKRAKRKSFRAFLRTWIAGSIAITLGAMAFTTPLCAIYFGSISLLGVLTNLTVLSLVGLIFPGVIVVCVVGLFHPGFAALLGRILGWPMEILLDYIRLLAKFPLAAVYTTSVYIVIWLISIYAMVGLYLLRKKRRARVLLCGCVISLCLALMVSWTVPMRKNVRLTVLDVGQGQCVILMAQGRTFLIDCGGEYDENTADLAAETLLSQGIFRIDGLILTHYDRDHAGGVAYFLSRIGADTVYLPDTQQITGAKEDILAVTDRAAIIERDIRIAWENCTIQIFAPVLSNSDNESGISVLFSQENYDILITGDMNTLGEALLLSEKQIPKLEVLVAGHHGSNNSTGQRLLEATRPDVAVISVGENSYGHPAREVLDRLEEYGCTVRRTDMEGTIVIRR